MNLKDPTSMFYNSPSHTSLPSWQGHIVPRSYYNRSLKFLKQSKHFQLFHAALCNFHSRPFERSLSNLIHTLTFILFQLSAFIYTRWKGQGYGGVECGRPPTNIRFGEITTLSIRGNAARQLLRTLGGEFGPLTWRDSLAGRVCRVYHFWGPFRNEKTQNTTLNTKRD